MLFHQYVGAFQEIPICILKGHFHIITLSVRISAGCPVLEPTNFLLTEVNVTRHPLVLCIRPIHRKRIPRPLHDTPTLTGSHL